MSRCEKAALLFFAGSLLLASLVNIPWVSIFLFLIGCVFLVAEKSRDD